MNSSFNVSLISTSSEINHSSSLTDVSSFLSERLNATNISQNTYQRNQNNSFLVMTSSPPMMSAASPPEQSAQQQNSSPSSPLSVYEMKQHSPNVTINSSLNARNPTTPSQMNYHMTDLPNVIINSSLTVRNPTTPSPSHMNYQMVDLPNVIINRSLTVRNPTTPSPSSQMSNQMMHSPNIVPSPSAPNPTPSPSLMSNQVHSTNFGNNSPSTGFSDLPPLTTSLQPLLPPLSSGYTSPFETYLNNENYIQPTLRDPPPYPTALQNNQSESTYTVLSSVQPFGIFSNSSTPVTSTASTYNQNGFSCIQNFQEFDEKMSDLPELIPIDEGIGTSPETSPGQHSQNSPGVAYGDDSMSAAYGSNVPVHPLFEYIQPKCEPADICTVCGGFLTLNSGYYQCETCNGTKPPKAVKKKKKPQKAATNKRCEKIICENCETEQTSLWRRDPNGLPLCNACGLYLKLHGHSRPKHMRKDRIQKRNRRPRNNETRIPRRETRNPRCARPAVAATNDNIRYSNSASTSSNAPSMAIQYSTNSTSSSAPRSYFAPTSSTAGPSTSYQLPSPIQNLNPTFAILNNTVYRELDNRNSQYRMMQL